MPTLKRENMNLGSLKALIPINGVPNFIPFR